MRKTVIALFCAMVCAAFISCSKDFRFKGYTPTSELGEQLGPEDTDDWTTEDDWGNAVHKLFDEQFEGECSLADKSLKEGADLIEIARVEGVGPAYPNPATSMVNVSFSLDTASKVQVLLVDRSQRVHLRTCVDLESGYKNISINLSDIDDRGELYRLFYKYISASGEYYGHGDIMVE